MTPTITKLEEERNEAVYKFVAAMRYNLEQNSIKDTGNIPGWRGETPLAIMETIHQEYAELLLAFACGAVGIFWTSLIARSIGATLLTYGCVLGWMGASALVVAPLISGVAGGVARPPAAALNLFLAIGMSTETVRIFGTTLPLWCPSTYYHENT